MIAISVAFHPTMRAMALSECCPADLSGNASVDASDVALLLGAWGGTEIDLDGDGTTGTSDLALLLEGWGDCPVGGPGRFCLSTTLVGIVVLAEGTPVANAVVVTSKGGTSTSGPDGSFVLDLEFSSKSTSLLVTAAATIGGSTFLGTKEVTQISYGGTTDVGEVAVSEADFPSSPTWLPTFGGRPGTNAKVRVITKFDADGRGDPAVIVGGDFTTAGGVAAHHIATWDGVGWSPLGGGVNGAVRSLVVATDEFDGTSVLYVGGAFTMAGDVEARGIAKWDGARWSALGSGVNGTAAALDYFDDGSGTGPALYVGGNFTHAGGIPAQGIARWNGCEWSSLESGLDGSALSFVVVNEPDDGASRLYVGGTFATAGGIAASSVAQWDGCAWAPLGSGIDGYVTALASFDDGRGGGPALYAGGNFTFAGGGHAHSIARWDGREWAPAKGVAGGWVEALLAVDGGSGEAPALYAGGEIQFSGVLGSVRLARLSHDEWTFIGGKINGTVSAIAAPSKPGATEVPELFVGGGFTTMGDVQADFVARGDGVRWSALGSGLNGAVDALAVFDDGAGGGAALYIGGDFRTAGGVPARHIARWDGKAWSEVGGGMDFAVWALTVFDDGSEGGPALYAAGNFFEAGGVPARSIARWDGRVWSALPKFVAGPIFDLVEFDDATGRGSALYASGYLMNEESGETMLLAKWDGSTWAAIGGGGYGGVWAMAIFDDGSGQGAALYLGGSFGLFSEEGLVSRIAKWDGHVWSPLGDGLDDSVFALAVFDDGSGPALYAGGFFTWTGFSRVNRIARWDGKEWSPLGVGADGAVYELEVADDGTGPALYAGGAFTSMGGITALRCARWRSPREGWSTLESGFDGAALSFMIYDDGGPAGPSLYVGGAFSTSKAGDSFLARWGEEQFLRRSSPFR